MDCICPERFSQLEMVHRFFFLPRSEALRKLNSEKFYKLSSLLTLPFCLLGVGTSILKFLVKMTSCSILMLFLLHTTKLHIVSNLDHLWISSLVLLIGTPEINKSVIRRVRRNTLQMGNYALSTRIRKQLSYPFPHLIRLISPSLFFFFLNDQLKK